MSSIEKLLIRGIRSFDPQTPAVIEFYTPLTIIVGHNGAGKTTIIECLKYATTGDLPPNSKGGAFIHDPKLANEHDVKAQIKLKFKNVNQKAMVCIRSIQLTQKKSKLEQKTLESLLTTIDPITGEQVSTSSRCMDLDAEMPLNLGVSKAILDSVIFCHQEESNWPLSEPSVLKKKFDDIFAATKYTKALDAIKSIRKEQIAEIKLDDQKYEFLKSNKEKARKIQTTKDISQRSIDQSNEKIAILENQLQELAQAMEKLMDEMKILDEMQTEISKFEHERFVCQNSIQELRQSISCILPDANEQLQQQILEKRKSLNEIEANYENSLEKRRTIQNEMSQKNDEYMKICTDIGRANAELAELSKKISSKDELCSQLATEYNLSIDQYPLSRDATNSFLNALKEFLVSKTEDTEAVMATMKAAEDSINAEIQSLSVTQRTNAESKKLKQQIMNSNSSNICSLNHSLCTLTAHPDELAGLNQLIKFEEDQLAKINENIKLLEYDSKMFDFSREKECLARELHSIHEQMSQLNAVADSRAKYEIKTEEMKKLEVRKKELIDEIISKCQFIPELTSKLWDSNLKRIIKDIFVQKKALYDVKEKEEESLMSQLNTISAKVDFVRKEINNGHAEVQKLQSKISDICDNVPLAQKLEDIKEMLDTNAMMLHSSDNSISMYQSFIKKAKKGHDCPLCSRNFNDAKTEIEFVKRLENVIALIPEKMKEAKAAKGPLEEEFKKVKSLEADQAMTERIIAQLPNLKIQLEQLEEKQDSLHMSVGELQSEKGSLKEQLDQLSIISKLIEDMSIIEKDLGELQKILDFLSHSLTSIDGTMSISQLQASQQKITEQIRWHEAEIEKLNAESKRLNRDMLAADSRQRELKEKKVKLEFDLQERLRLTSEIERLTMENRKLEEELHKLTSLSTEISTKLLDWNTKKNQLLAENIPKAQILQQKLNQISIKIAQLSSMHDEIERSCARYDDQIISTLETKQRQLSALLMDLKSHLVELDNRLSGLQREKSELLIFERNVADNLKLRELEAKLDALTRQTGEKIANLHSLDRASYDSKWNVMKAEQSKKLGERAGLLGEIKQLEDQIKRLQHELNTDYHDVEEDCKKQFIKLRTLQIANEDLEKYAKALDNAIMKYHSLKMEELNKIIRELWVATYQGSDIDTIEIRSDNEGVSGNRSYNYRVVMIKDNVELDMRGRCSAGQRVLTSLIIRLALAESFGVNCGILALDEPTTNLDGANIQSLAESLAGIIRARRQQSNFQLIIITHDEDFVQLLGRSEYAEYYWRVQKNEHQHSTIDRHAFAHE